jgi:hypothetical protein
MGDLKRSLLLANEAIEIYERVGMKEQIEELKKMLQRLEQKM